MRKGLIGLALLAVLAALGVGGYIYAPRYVNRVADRKADRTTQRFKRALTSALNEALARQDSAVSAISRRFENIDNLSTSEELELRQYRYSAHMQEARALGVGRVSGMNEVGRFVEQDRLVRLEDTTRYYYIQEINYSVPYVTPDMAQLLELIGQRFHDKLRAHNLPLYRYTISSLLRTGENQQALRAINPNAASSLSAHELGTTIDVVYHDYRYSPMPNDTLRATSFEVLNQRLERMRRERYNALGMRYWQELKGLLGRTLIELQREGQVRALLERNQPVFHFTVAAPLAES